MNWKGDVVGRNCSKLDGMVVVIVLCEKSVDCHTLSTLWNPTCTCINLQTSLNYLRDLGILQLFRVCWADLIFEPLIGSCRSASCVEYCPTNSILKSRWLFELSAVSVSWTAFEMILFDVSVRILNHLVKTNDLTRINSFYLFLHNGAFEYTVTFMYLAVWWFLLS